jgi:hypothetical protein
LNPFPNTQWFNSAGIIGYRDDGLLHRGHRAAQIVQVRVVNFS